MTCYKPIIAYRSSSVNPTGKRSLVFNRSKSDGTSSLAIPCGQCIGCRLERSRQWATRIALENELHDESIFLTLTYDDDHLPEDGSLNPDHFTKFMKDIRSKIAYRWPDKKIRFFGCGEYGSQLSRPHFHIIIFGWQPSDKVFYKNSGTGPLFISKFIEDVWKNGFCPFGSVTFESAAYVARYCCKKITGQLAEFYYDGLEPEFVRMSRRPGIGFEWLKKYKDDVKRDDYIVVRNGIKIHPPKYFDRIFEKWFPDYMELVKEKRMLDGKSNIHNNLVQRDLDPDFNDYFMSAAKYHSFSELERSFYDYHVLPVKEEVKKSQYLKLKRGIEDGSM